LSQTKALFVMDDYVLSSVEVIMHNT